MLQTAGARVEGLAIVQHGKVHVHCADGRGADQAAAAAAAAMPLGIWAGGWFGAELRSMRSTCGDADGCEAPRAAASVVGASGGGRLLFLRAEDVARLLLPPPSATPGGVELHPWTEVVGRAVHAGPPSQLGWRAADFEAVGYLGVGAFGRVTAVRCEHAQPAAWPVPSHGIRCVTCAHA